MRKLFIEHQCTSGFEQKHIFVKMIHAFMQELCGYLPNSYSVTLAAYGNAKIAGYPHVVPVSYSFKSTLFYFTSSEDPDDIHNLWVKNAQIYLFDPHKGDVAAERATNVVFTNFFIIDGAIKDEKTGAWNLWSASDIEGSQIARVDLRNLESSSELALTTSQLIHKRLQTIQHHR